MLVSIGNGHSLSEKAAEAFKLMSAAAVQVGVVLHVNSSTRDTTKQRLLYAAYVVKLAKWEDAGSNLVDRPPPVAKPGTSEHEEPRAIAVDIDVTDPHVLIWLMQHGPSYGFYATAANERWHWAWYGLGLPDRMKARHTSNLKRWR